MSNDCSIRGYNIPVVTPFGAKERKALTKALLAEAAELGVELSETRIKGLFKADESQDEFIIVEDGLLSIHFDFYGNGGYQSDEATVFANALDQFVTGPAWFTTVDHDMSPSSDEAVTFYSLGRNDAERDQARVLYGLSLAEEFWDRLGADFAKNVREMALQRLQSQAQEGA